MPITRNDEDMPKWGWKKELMYESIKCDETTQNRPILFERDYYADNQRCGKCRSNEYVWVIVPSYDYMGGVFAGCSRCGIVWGQLGSENVSNERTLEVTPEKAIEICLATKQPIPRALRDLARELQSEKARTRKGKPARPARIRN